MTVDSAQYKRHSVPRTNFRQRVAMGPQIAKLSSYEGYYKAMTETIPAVESSVEEDILAHYKEHLSPTEQMELELAWKQRLEKTKQTAKQPREYLSPFKDIPAENIDMFKEIMFIGSKDLRNLSMEHIGRYIEIPEAAARVLFRNGCFGRYLRDDFGYHSLVAFMVREETVKLVHAIKMSQRIGAGRYHQEARAKNAEFIKSLAGMPPHMQLEKLLAGDEATFFLLMARLSYWMNHLIDARKDPDLDTLFRNSPDLFDSAINLIVSKLSAEPLFNYLFGSAPIDLSTLPMAGLSALVENSRGRLCELLNSFIDICNQRLTREDKLGQVSMQKFRDYISKTIELKFGSNSIIIDLAPLKKWEEFHPRPESINKMFGKYAGFGGTTVLTGESGVGKSGVLNGLALWAHIEGSYVVVKVPRGIDITQSNTLIKWHKSGLYMQPELAFDILAELEAANRDALAKIPVNPALYGKYNLAGLHDVQDKDYIPLPAQHKWLEDLQVFSDDWRRHYSEEILLEMDKPFKEHNLPLRESRIDHEIGILTQRPVPPDVERQVAREAKNAESVSKNEGEGEEQNSGDISELEPEDITWANTAAKLYPKKMKLPKSSAETLIYRPDLRPTHPEDLTINPELYPKIEETQSPIDLLKKKLSELAAVGDLNEGGSKNLPSEETIEKMSSKFVQYNQPDFNFSKFGDSGITANYCADRMSERLPQPKTLRDIALFALNNHVYCTNAICEILEQLKHTEVANVLVLVDDFSDFFRPTKQPSVKYVNYKECGGGVPAWDLALGRAFMRLDGHRFKNGCKVVAATNYAQRQRTWKPADGGIIPHFALPVEPLPLNDFRMACIFYRYSGWLPQTFRERDIQVTYMHSQGNWRCAHKLMNAFTVNPF